jgi:hypothetical protein
MFAASIMPVRLSAEDEERSLAILGRLLLEEIAASGTAEQRRGMLIAIGRRVAALMPLGAKTDLAAVEERINGLWAALRWGSVGFEIDDSGIDIVHRGLPTPYQDQLQDWQDVLPPVLEGAYAAWFSQMSDGVRNLHTRITASKAGQVEFRHGL